MLVLVHVVVYAGVAICVGDRGVVIGRECVVGSVAAAGVGNGVVCVGVVVVVCMDVGIASVWRCKW